MSAEEHAWGIAAERAARTGKRRDKAAEEAAFDRMIAAENAVAK